MMNFSMEKDCIALLRNAGYKAHKHDDRTYSLSSADDTYHFDLSHEGGFVQFEDFFPCADYAAKHNAELLVFVNELNACCPMAKFAVGDDAGKLSIAAMISLPIPFTKDALLGIAEAWGHLVWTPLLCQESSRKMIRAIQRR